MNGRGRTFATFGEYASVVRPRLDAGLVAQIDTVLGGTGTLGAHGSFLLEGKKTRGSLLCLVATVLGGSLERALPRAIAVELIQAATLIHDDFVDQHRTRRHRPALWTLEGARRAVLLGDVLFASAIRMMSETSRQDGLIVSRAIADVSQGAFREPADPAALSDMIEEGRVGPALYRTLIHLKTGVLFEAACHLGAVAADVNDASHGPWRHYGACIGEAYQIADDRHDVRRSLETGTIEPLDLATLAPALLFFVETVRPTLCSALRAGSTIPLTGALRAAFERMAETMASEIDRRLAAASATVAPLVADEGYGRIVRRAPQGLIETFDGSETVAAS